MAKMYLDAFQVLVSYKVDSGITEQKNAKLNTNVKIPIQFSFYSIIHE